MKKCLFSVALVLLFIPTTAHADVSLFMLESVGVAGEFTGSGHTAIYFSNICADGPTRLRLCQPGEQGAVISNYPDFSKNSPHEWMAIPVIPYLYGVERERDIPLYANGKLRNFLRENYRRKYLASIIPDNPDGTMPEGGWRTMLTMAFNRDIYSFNVRTTVEEDAQFLKEFNTSTGKGEFNSFTRNCADFARKVINRYFPGAARRDVINDFGITTPKAIAKSLTSYASDQPQRLFNITRYSQVSGPIWRSYDNRSFTEKALTSKKYLIPSLVFYPPLYAVFAGAYLTTGRFSVHQAYREYATPRIAQLNLEEYLLKKAQAEQHATEITFKEIAERKKAEKTRLFGDRQLWDGYKANFAPVLKSAIAQGLFQDKEEVTTFFRDLEIQSEPAFDADGAPLLVVSYYGEKRALGITRHNILSTYSDQELACKLMLAKISANLNALEKDRISLEEFRADWELMRGLSASLAAASKNLPGVAKNRGRFLKTPIRTDTKRGLFKTFLSITR
ncbi:MAG TPA: hypothetical protein VGX92_11760 [Pyrinomonadaceae bacterium]|jgi:hypothetical protein|nr:hypothetical protein [Pyrinomonadaceae bacterium]